MNNDEFYVGYFPMPKRHKKFLWVILSSLVFLIFSLAFAIASSQKNPGD